MMAATNHKGVLVVVWTEYVVAVVGRVGRYYGYYGRRHPSQPEQWGGSSFHVAFSRSRSVANNTNKERQNDGSDKQQNPIRVYTRLLESRILCSKTNKQRERYRDASCRIHGTVMNL